MTENSLNPFNIWGKTIVKPLFDDIKDMKDFPPFWHEYIIIFVGQLSQFLILTNKNVSFRD